MPDKPFDMTRLDPLPFPPPSSTAVRMLLPRDPCLRCEWTSSKPLEDVNDETKICLNLCSSCHHRLPAVRVPLPWRSLRSRRGMCWRGDQLSQRSSHSRWGLGLRPLLCLFSLSQSRPTRHHQTCVGTLTAVHFNLISTPQRHPPNPTSPNPGST